MLAAYKRCWRPEMLAAENVGVQTLTIWARQNLHFCLLLSPAEGLSLLHEVLSPPEELSLKWCCLSSMQASSGICSQTCPAYMGGVSAVLYRLVCTGTTCPNIGVLSNIGGRRYFTFFLGIFADL